MRLKYCLFSLIFSGTAAVALAQDKVLLTINGEPTYVSEFEYIYNKNNDATTIDPKTVTEYIDLFVNFKLKVAEAKAYGIDTTEAFINELAGYRKQLAAPYFLDNEAKEALLQEAYERKCSELELSHILIQIPGSGTAADTLEAYNKALLVKERIEATETQGAFETIAREISSDPSAQQNGGYLGWITAFRTVYPFETGAYNTPVGEISNPIRSPFGYHLIKVNDKRKAQGEVFVSHIMTFTNPRDEQVNEAAKSKIDSIYQCVLAGEDFATLAQQTSQDRGSAANGGELPWFSTGRMVPEFEKAAFALKEINSICAPIQSMYGWHIIKLLDKKPLGTYDELKEDLAAELDRDSRNAKINENFIGRLKEEYHFSQNKESLKLLYVLATQNKISDSTFVAEAQKINGELFSFGGKNYTVANFAEYVSENKNSKKVIPQEIIDEKVNAFAAQELLAYEDGKLEEKHAAFRNLINEYHDGILLFEISNQKVWERSSTDVEGITKFFKKNKRDYAWDEPHYKGHIIMCKDEETMNIAQQIVKKCHRDSIESYLYTRMNDSIQYVKVERGLYVQGENPIIDKYVFDTGDYEPTEDYPYVFVAGKMLKKLPETYTDVRGAVTSDYQNYLEERWIKDMRKKYSIWIDETVLNNIK